VRLGSDATAGGGRAGGGGVSLFGGWAQGLRSTQATTKKNNLVFFSIDYIGRLNCCLLGNLQKKMLEQKSKKERKK
jgi:hypothetical protein